MDIWQIIKLWQASISASIKWLYYICLPSLIDLGSKLDDHYYYSFKFYLLFLSGYKLLLFDSAADGRKASVVLIDITQSLNKCSLFNTLVSGSLISVSEKNASIFLKTTINYNKNIFAEKICATKTVNVFFLSAVSYSLR